jgi:hypothetical protein
MTNRDNQSKMEQFKAFGGYTLQTQFEIAILNIV